MCLINRPFAGFAIVVLTLLLAWPLTAETASDKQTYKWVDEQGQPHYTDDPYEANKHGIDVILPGAISRKNKTTSAGATSKSSNKGEGHVVMVGDIRFTNSDSGWAVINATLKNDGSSPVEAVQLDVILFHVERRRAADLFIPFTGGKIKPDRLNPGETGTIEYETNVTPEEIAGHRYRITWDTYKNVVKPGKKPAEQRAPEPAVTKPAPPKEKSIKKEPAPETAKSKTRLKIEAKRKLREKLVKESE
ncbi:hypothetical protein MNBD_NITROSPINAE01-722 [hydrothermal vent metagenome]|uniref:DUF4124 domain-containing protein n=1 Tax=hydrothermal vent metagenome TaxID=652676 RepID=A0A3B1BZF3_9ZZZZ